MKQVLILFTFFVLSSSISQAGGIRGVIYDENNQPLPFATVYVEKSGTGTASNADGFYELKLRLGSYKIIFQFIGYETLAKEITVGEEFQELNVVLKTQTMVLQDVKIYAGKEDPAYTIMRKAIAKSKFHLQQVDRYTAKVYIKGTGRLIDSPFFLRKELKKEGIDPDRVFISESVSEVEYVRPNTYNEKVISIYSSGDDNNTSPNAYVNGSFYEAEVAKSISPLSPKAFSYYRFVYDGTFHDRGYEISKIKVIPRSKGDNVFEGYIHIVEDYWSIYSLDLSVTKLGIDFHVKQIYAPVEENVWLPVTHDFEVQGKVWGFKFEGDYLATVSDYKVEINPDLNVEIKVIDEKVQEELAENLKGQFDDKSELSEVQELLESGNEVTRKQLNKIIKAYEKSELKELEEPEIVGNRTMKIDSMAYDRDSSYWSVIRPVPLSNSEEKGYHISDSIAQIEKKEREGDTLKTTNSKFQIQDLLFGKTYKIKDRTHLALKSAFPQYNTVEGFNLDYTIAYSKTLENKNWVQFGPTIRYAFAREKLSGFMRFQYAMGERYKRSDFDFRVGRYISQYNDEEPIHPFVNTFMSLFLERNYMKIYEKDFAKFNYSKKFGRKVIIRFSGEVAERRELINQTDYRFFDREGKGLTINSPTHEELSSTSFQEHRAVISGIKIEYQPWVKYHIYNDRKYVVDGSSPVFSINLEGGIPDVLDSKTDFILLEAGVKHQVKIGIRGLLDYNFNAGTFLKTDQMTFIDYKHFMGNRTPFITTDPVGNFRLLDYYRYSTKEEYFSANLNYQFRKFLVTRVPLLRLAGIRENVFTNYLANDQVSNYYEVGYSINYILRIFRVEAVTSFIDGKYQDFGVRIGIATNLDNIF